jgi:predicted amidophosphoribosyltransferase
MKISTKDFVICENCDERYHVFPCDECDGTNFILVGIMLICKKCGRDFYDWRCPNCGKQNPHHKTIVKKTA